MDHIIMGSTISADGGGLSLVEEDYRNKNIIYSTLKLLQQAAYIPCFLSILTRPTSERRWSTHMQSEK